MNIISSTTGNTLQSATTQRPVTTKVLDVLSVASTAVNTTQNASALEAKSNTPKAKAKAQTQVSSEEVQRATEDVQRRLTTLAPELELSVDQSSGRSIIKFTDRTTNKVIQQFPSEAILQMSKELDRFQKGLLLNKKA
jgi:flagellar protein FlaG